MAEMHSICGLFNEEFRGVTPFGGYLIVEKSGVLKGFLNDIYGLSEISTGSMTESRLDFLKKYLKGEDLFKERKPIQYRFNIENGVWKGEYVMSDGRIGRAVCKTAMCFDNLEFHTYNSNDCEAWAKFMVEGLINSGHVEVFKDPKTGERLIRPVDKNSQ